MGLFSDGVAGLHGGAPAVKENYRSIGRGSGGVAVSSKRNCHWRDFDCATTPSIPGKFETVLYQGNREDGGFGSRAPRFGQEERQGELPGPGHHDGPAGLARRGLVDNTVGKRGNGFFASRTPRQQAAKGSQAPGPGFYGAPSSSDSAPSSETRPNASFVPPTSVNPAKYTARPSPGPGDYSGAIGLATSSNSKFKVDNTGAVMCQRGEPGDGPSKTETPGPGAYYRERHRPASSEPGRQGSSLLKTPRFEPPVKGASEAGLLRLGAELLAEDAAQSSSKPGPGQYDPKPESTSGGGPVSFCVGETYAFRLGNSHKSRRWRPDGPGPCDYEAPPGRRLGDATTSLKSKVARFKDEEAPAPGPAYYSPRKTADTDFHLNPHSMWK